MTRAVICASIFSFCAGAVLFAQAWQQGAIVSNRLQLGVELYGQGKWGEAIIELRKAQAENQSPQIRSEAQFWIAMSELSAGKFQDAVHSLDEIIRINPSSERRLEIPYQKGRAFFYLGRYNEAIILFKEYADSIQVDGRYFQGVYSSSNNNDAYNRKAAAIYWVGECLYNLEQWDKAAEMFELVIKQYPQSIKYETSSNRLALIKQKKTEEGLLEIIRLSSLQPTVVVPPLPSAPQPPPNNAYDDAVLAYKNSIAPFLMQLPPVTKKKTGTQDPDTMMRLLNIKTQALEMMDRLTSALSAFETLEWEGW